MSSPCIVIIKVLTYEYSYKKGEGFSFKEAAGYSQLLPLCMFLLCAGPFCTVYGFVL